MKRLRKKFGSLKDAIGGRFNAAKTYITRPEAKSDAIALIHDGASYTLKGVRKIVSPPALTIAGLVLAAVIGVGTVSAITIAADTFNKHSRDLHNPSIIMNKKNTGTTIKDRNGVTLYQAYGAVDRNDIPFEEMPEAIKKATVATEDASFYAHPGVSWRGTLRALYQDIRHTGMIQGGSTITQQLVKNTLLSNEKSITRKYKEVLLSIDLERRYDKNQILQMYLNTIYYGQGAYGIESASQTYFQKSARDLTLEESALLAGLPQSPSRYDPNVNIEAATERRNYVLDRMVETKQIDDMTARVAKDKAVVAGTREVVLKAPHFVFYVLDQLRQQYGQDTIEKGGIVVETTLDYEKQLKAEEIVRTQVEKLAPKNASNGALVSVDPRDGDILNMVGSIGYSNPNYGAVNVTLSQLQPGSSFKPIAYATAFSKGWNGATKVDDKPMRVVQTDGQVYEPRNYDGTFRGPVTLRRALANSLNIPALEVMKFASLPDTIGLAHNLGIQAPSLTEQSRYGLSLVLGGGEVRMIDMATVYAGFANQGTSVTPRAITKVQGKYGEDVTKPDKKQPKPVIDKRIAFMITNILSDNESRKEEFGTNSPLKLASRPAAVKTGTTDDFRDNWAVGYTPQLATAVWVGNNDNSPMSNVDGVTGAAPIWNQYMEVAHEGIPSADFPVPDGVVFAKVCPTDGGLVDENDPSGVREVFLAEAKPTKRCGWAAPEPEEKKEEKKEDNKPPTETAQSTPPPGRGGAPDEDPDPSEEPKEPPKDPGGGGNPGSGSPNKPNQGG